MKGIGDDISMKSRKWFNNFSIFSKIFLLLVTLLVLLPACSEEEPIQYELNIYDKLRNLDGVTVTEIDANYGYPRAFQIDFVQPVDHNNPDGPTFTQRMYLSHTDEDAPMVFAPSGYMTSARSSQDLAQVLGSNCLNVSHRYFPDSRPSPVDWQYCTVRQAAADHHRIVNLFKTIYTGAWVSAGYSKSGMTCLFHKRYYPNDVDAVVAYVAPFMFSLQDHRFYEFFKTIGDETSRNMIFDFQRVLLENRDDIAPLYAQWFPENGYTLAWDPDEAYEGSVLSYSWVYWQYWRAEITDIPGETATPEEMFEHLARISSFFGDSESGVDYFLAWYYQSNTELGHPEVYLDNINDMIQHQGVTVAELFLDRYGITLSYSNATMLEIYNWLRTQGNNIIYLYGGDDPWTGGAVELTGRTNAMKFIHPGGHHGVRLAEFAERDQVVAALEEWLGITITNPFMSNELSIPMDAFYEDIMIAH